MATVRKTKNNVIYTITLSEPEAILLSGILGNVGGEQGYARRLVENLASALSEANTPDWEFNPFSGKENNSLYFKPGTNARFEQEMEKYNG